MDSIALRGLGFGSWTPISVDTETALLSGLPVSCGVYAFLFAKSMTRQRGISDIAYIGKASNQNGLRGRVRQYFHPGPTQSTNLAMKRRLAAVDCSLQLGFVVSNSAPMAARLEADLLRQFVHEHAELPPYNRQLPFVVAPPEENESVSDANPRPTGRATFHIVGFDQGGVQGTARNLRLVCLLEGGGKLAIWGSEGASGNIDKVTKAGTRCTVDCEFQPPAETQARKYGHTHWVHQGFDLAVVS